MIRHVDSTRRQRAPRPLASALLLLALAIPATAGAAPAAIDEYSLGALEATDLDPANTQRPPPSRDRPDDRGTSGRKEALLEGSSGVVGESSPAPSPLAAAGASAGAGVWLLAGLLTLAGGVALLRAPARRSGPQT